MAFSLPRVGANALLTLRNSRGYRGDFNHISAAKRHLAKSERRLVVAFGQRARWRRTAMAFSLPRVGGDALLTLRNSRG